MTRPKDAILQDLAREQDHLTQLARAHADVIARIKSLRVELAATSTATGTVQPRSSAEIPRTPAEKVSLFRSLFRGRPDVFPTRFVSRKTGKAGYAPACANKFKPGICGLKTGGKCGDCSNQAFFPVDDRMILDHLRGKHVMGVYPLLDDETCWLLAVDFDGAGWKEDVAAFIETCRSAGVGVAIERSRSGNGAHAWFFFAAPVPARTAREMGVISSRTRWAVATSCACRLTIGSSRTRIRCRAAGLAISLRCPFSTSPERTATACS
jgi:hypothetical protein